MTLWIDIIPQEKVTLPASKENTVYIWSTIISSVFSILSNVQCATVELMFTRVFRLSSFLLRFTQSSSFTSQAILYSKPTALSNRWVHSGSNDLLND